MTATVEEYHPEVVAFAKRFAERMATDYKFDNKLFHRVCEADANENCAKLIQFLLSECATPLKQGDPQ